MAVIAIIQKSNTDIDDSIEYNINDYSYTEDGTTIDPGNFSGGVGQITMSLPENSRSRNLLGAYLYIQDSELGNPYGVIRSVTSGAEGTATLTGDSIIGLYNAYFELGPYDGTLGGAFDFYFNQVHGYYNNETDPAIADRPVSYPGYKGNLWDCIKQIAAAEQVEIALVDTSITARPLRTITYDTNRLTDYTWTLNSQNTARKVRVHYYGNTYLEKGEVYPVPQTPALPGEEPTTNEPTIYSVEAGEVQTFDIQLSASLKSVNTPLCIDFVQNRSYAGTNGVYAVAGNDGLPIPAAQWLDQGGSVTAELTEDASVIRVKIVGASGTAYAPYRLAMSAGTSDYYNALHLTGEGVFIRDQVIDIVTGATESVTGEEIGAEVTNPFISTKGQALNAGQQTAGAQAMLYTSDLRMDVPKYGRDDLTGYLGGARYRIGDAMFRVSTATMSPAEISFNGSIDTTIADFDASVPEGTTMGEFSTAWTDQTMLDFSVEPLRGL